MKVLPTYDASKVTASGPGLSSYGIPASLPVEFAVDAKDAGQGLLTVQITVSNCKTMRGLQQIVSRWDWVAPVWSVHSLQCSEDWTAGWALSSVFVKLLKLLLWDFCLSHHPCYIWLIINLTLCKCPSKRDKYRLFTRLQKWWNLKWRQPAISVVQQGHNVTSTLSIMWW